jgi:hypothetical protein
MALPDLRFWNYAACSGMPLDFFFLKENKRGGEYIHRADANAACNRCPVFVQCIDDALRDKDRKGIWAGTDESDRATMHKEQEESAEDFFKLIDPVVRRVVQDVKQTQVRRMQGVLSSRANVYV